LSGQKHALVAYACYCLDGEDHKVVIASVKDEEDYLLLSAHEDLSLQAYQDMEMLGIKCFRECR